MLRGSILRSAFRTNLADKADDNNTIKDIPSIIKNSVNLEKYSEKRRRQANATAELTSNG